MNTSTASTTRVALWLRLFLLGLFACVAASPFLFHFLAATVARSGYVQRVPIAVLVAIAIAQVSLYIGLAAWAFVALGPYVDLDAPVLRGERRLRDVLAPSITAGSIAALLIVATSLVLRPFLPAQFLQAESGALDAIGGSLLGISGAFYGGIIEEMMMRLGLMTLLAFAFSKASVPKAVAIQGANLVTALLFGLGHLPAMHSLHLPFTPMLVTYIVLANAIGGIVFGWLYARRGIESAMVAHFTCDVWIHVVLRSFL